MKGKKKLRVTAKGLKESLQLLNISFHEFTNKQIMVHGWLEHRVYGRTLRSRLVLSNEKHSHNLQHYWGNVLMKLRLSQWGMVEGAPWFGAALLPLGLTSSSSSRGKLIPKFIKECCRICQGGHLPAEAQQKLSRSSAEAQQKLSRNRMMQQDNAPKQ